MLIFGFVYFCVMIFAANTGETQLWEQFPN